MNLAIGYGNALLKLAKDRGMGILGMKSMIERGFLPRDDALRRRWPKSWCKPFDPKEQGDILLAAMKYAVTLGADTLIPAGDIEHFRFAIEHADAIWNEPLTEEERQLLEKHLPTVRDALFMPGRDR